MTSASDELFDDPSYFNPKFDADKIEERERKKARLELAKAKRPPLNKRKLLLDIAHDPNESYSVRSDARRLLQIADAAPSRFEQEFRDFQAWRKETNNDRKSSDIKS
jgi:hypothetical protein